MVSSRPAGSARGWRWPAPGGRRRTAARARRPGRPAGRATPRSAAAPLSVTVELDRAAVGLGPLPAEQPLVGQAADQGAHRVRAPGAVPGPPRPRRRRAGPDQPEQFALRRRQRLGPPGVRTARRAVRRTALIAASSSAARTRSARPRVWRLCPPGRTLQARNVFHRANYIRITPARGTTWLELRTSAGSGSADPRPDRCRDQCGFHRANYIPGAHPMSSRPGYRTPAGSGAVPRMTAVHSGSRAGCCTSTATSRGMAAALRRRPARSRNSAPPAPPATLIMVRTARLPVHRLSSASWFVPNCP